MMGYLKQILLVEDDPHDVELTLTVLAEHHLANAVTVARDGVEALDYVYCTGRFAGRSDRNPVVILLDLKIPKLDGIQVLKQLKSDEQMRCIPVVILSSSRETRDLNECYTLGVNAYVVKPVRFTEFVAAIEQIGVFWAIINEPPPDSGNTP